MSADPAGSWLGEVAVVYTAEKRIVIATTPSRRLTALHPSIIQYPGTEKESHALAKECQRQSRSDAAWDLPDILDARHGTLVWTAALALAGYLLGQAYSVVFDYVDPISTAILVLLVVAY